MFKDYEDLIKQMELEMQRCSAEAMRRLLELPAAEPEFWVPKADTYETPEGLVIRVEIAGVPKESLSVTLSADGRILNVQGNRSEAFIDNRRKERYYQLECYFGHFERDIPIPPGISIDRDRISAKYKEGFLIVTLPKLEHIPTSRKVPIEGQSGEEKDSDKL